MSEKALLIAHGLCEQAQPVDQGRTGGGCGVPALFAAPQGADQLIEAFCRVLEHGFGIGRRTTSIAVALQAAAGNARCTGEPFLEFDMEAPLSLAGLKFEEAQNQRTRKTE